MSHNQKHQQEVRVLLQNHFSCNDWNFSLPHGSGKESYFVQGNGQRYFVKIGVQAEYYQVMAEIGLTPPVVFHGQLESRITVIVQPFIEGRKPSRKDFRERMNDVAKTIHKLHNDPLIRKVLQAAHSEMYKDAGLLALDHILQKWERYKAQVPSEAGFVDDSLEQVKMQVNQFAGEGLVTSHGDICNANWLFTSNGEIYLIDFDLIKMDDPALDVGALLWWYYPPDLRASFLEVTGYRYDDAFKFRMKYRMAMHFLNIFLPRDNSFDQFKSESFGASLRDFRAVLEGNENPKGYE